MYFLIFKPKLKFITYTNQVFGNREDAEDFAKRSFKKKDACKEELRDTHIEIVSLTKANEITKLTPSTTEQLQEEFEG